jgi:hypothetical protein
MELTYDSIVKYMNEYFEVFNTYGQNPATIHRMDEYFAPDFEFVPYVATIPKVVGRAPWYDVLLSHPSGYEKLTPEDMVIDERRQVVVVLIKAEIMDSKTREVLVTKRYFARYPLVLDENKTIKIKKLEFFWEVLPPGSMEIDDVFDRDRKPHQSA